MVDLETLLSSISNVLYTYILIILLMGCGLYLSFKTKFAQIRFFLDSLKLVTEKSDKGVSSFQALMIATASRVGVGNIVGVATAIIVGGPGAIFWMWAIAILGSASACIESTLAQIYKVKNKDGVTFRGGPAYYIQRMSGNKKLGMLFSWLLILCFSCGFNGLQAFNFSSSFEHYIPNYKNSFWPYIIGLGLSAIIFITVSKGVKNAGIISSVLVPIKSAVYIGIALYATFTNLDKLPVVFESIIRGAFDFKAIFGGFFSSALLVGIKRGLFSNEAGMGSAPNAAATATVDHPAKQGIAQIFSILLDTLVCTSTAFLIFSSGINISPTDEGLYIVQQALYNQFGSFGVHFISLSIFLFSFSAIIGNHCYSESNILFIYGSERALKIFRFACIIPIFIGTIVSSQTAWSIADIFMGLMAVMNITFILIGSKQAIDCLNDYAILKKQNKPTKFVASKYGITNTVWK